MELKIKKLSENFKGLEVLEKGDWIDIYVCGSKSHTEKDGRISYKKGDNVFIEFGFACQLPDGYEAYILPRSSTFKKTNLILSNSQGVIDNSYCGNDDQWLGMFYATNDGDIEIGQRIAQFRVQEKMKKPKIVYVDNLEGENRGGYGSTGK